MSSLSPKQQEAERLGVIEKFDSFSNARAAASVVADHLNEYAGIPLPITDEKLIVAPSYLSRFAADVRRAMCSDPNRLHEDSPKDGTKEEEAQLKFRTSFYSTKLRSNVITFTKPNGHVAHGVDPACHHLYQDLKTLGCSVAWGISQEHAALQLLGTLIRHHAFKYYLLTGMFLETSRKSGVTYLFRKLKPTVALKNERILAALCMHPIAYYDQSWAGAMCPTDDVIAHLTLMRADEHLYWRRCNQHAAHKPEAGL